MSKYHAKKETIDGITFASKKEAQRYRELKLMERAGAIRGLQLQVPFDLVKKSKYGRAIRYIADFVYWEDDKMVVEDTKGVRLPVYKLKARLMQELFDITIKET